VPGVPGDLPALDVALTVELDAGRAVLGGAISTAGGELAIERGELVFGPPESFFAGAQLDLDVHAGFDDFAPLAQALGLEGSGTLAGSIDVDGPLGALTGHLQAAARGVVIRGAAFDGIEVDAVARDGRFEVLDCELAGTGWSTERTRPRRGPSRWRSRTSGRGASRTSTCAWWAASRAARCASNRCSPRTAAWCWRAAGRWRSASRAASP
jgi:hypothetical protein